MSFIILITTLSCFMKHPLTLGLILLIQTLLIALLTGLMSLNFWSSYIIFLIMIGGMLILFIYMTSIASNEKFKFSTKILLYSILTITMINLTSYSLDKFFLSQKLKMVETFTMQDYVNVQFFMNKYINFPHNMIYMMMIMYLLLTLIAVVKITTKTKSTLRKNF
uniref:NADH-ubiquinone oxidoreductase chain 6 n=1 Tax=Cryptocephalus octoguttatus TaxID=1091372 RepID=A0A3G1GP19_9CUCU|nr:NADH dehydrogenase subunit 6 [Cryptocephalus octoguttatus]